MTRLSFCFIVVLGFLCFTNSFAQVSPSGYGASINLGANFPSEDGFETGLALKANGHFYLGSIIANLSFLYDSPQAEFSDADFSISGFTGGISIPFAPESSTTPYIRGGLGVFKSKASNSSFTTESDWKFGYDLAAGFRFMPQQWRNSFIVIEGSYRGISFEETWNNFDLTAGVGFDF